MAITSLTLKSRGNDLTGLTRSHGGTLTQLEDGTWESVAIFHCLWKDAARLAPRRFVSQHPDFNTLICNSTQCQQLKPGTVGKITVTYRGLLDDTVVPLEDIISNTSEAPIETHNKFTTILGGSSDDPKNGAVFDDDGKFTGFKATSKYAGVMSYLTPGTIYRETYPVKTRPTSIAGVGKVAALATPIDLPNLVMNWLLISMTWSRQGNVYVIVKEYMLSGLKGWDSDVYGS